MERFTLHLNVLAEVLITIHSGGKLSELHLVSLVEVEGLSFHLDVLTEVFVAIHASGELSELLVEVERLSLHLDVFSEILIAIHTGSKVSGVSRSLIEVERLTLHLDILTKVLVTVHASSELREAGDTVDGGSGTCGTNLKETGSSGDSLVVREYLGGLRAVRRLLLGSNNSEKSGNNVGFHIIIPH